MTFLARHFQVRDRPGNCSYLPSSQNTGHQQHKENNSKRKGLIILHSMGMKIVQTLNKTGTILCRTTNKEHHCMNKISCKSFNLIDAITCKRCGLHYIGHTLIRIRDMFTGDFGDIDHEKTIGRHFSKLDHQGADDMISSVIEFIKNPPDSEEAVSIIINKSFIHNPHTYR